MILWPHSDVASLRLRGIADDSFPFERTGDAPIVVDQGNLLARSKYQRDAKILSNKGRTWATTLLSKNIVHRTMPDPVRTLGSASLPSQSIELAVIVPTRKERQNAHQVP